jgi:type VI secretion system protein ImpG
VQALSASPIRGRLVTPDGVFLRRGLKIVVELSREAEVDSGAYLFGTVLENFFAQHVSMNSFTELELRRDGQEAFGWKPRDGRRRLI